MFSGIVEGTAKVVELIESREPRRLSVELSGVAERMRLGESVAINGVCLTAVHIEGGEVGFDVMGETLRRTNLGRLKRGDLVNYERALKVNDRISGHIVTGHIDGVGVIERIERRPEEVDMIIKCKKRMMPEIVERGSVAVDGVSLTVAERFGSGFRVALIPHTLNTTNLGLRRVGDELNIETDILAKYVRGFLQNRNGTIDRDFLQEHGFF